MITIDANSSSGAQAAVTSFSWNHTVGGDGISTVLVVMVGSGDDTNYYSPSGITFDGVALTQINSTGKTDTALQSDLWYLKKPHIGTHAIEVTMDGSCDHAVGYGMSLLGVEQGTGCINTTATDTSISSDAPSAALTTTVDNCFIVDVVVIGVNTDFAPGAGQTEVYAVNIATSGDLLRCENSYKTLASAGATTMSWAQNGRGGLCAAAFAPGKAGGGAFLLNML
jgi:hypothetical protein